MKIVGEWSLVFCSAINFQLSGLLSSFYCFLSVAVSLLFSIYFYFLPILHFVANLLDFSFLSKAFSPMLSANKFFKYIGFNDLIHFVSCYLCSRNELCGLTELV